MSYCINPHCPRPIDPTNAKNRICHNCGSDLVLKSRYRVLKQLGSGGFGQTFEVDDSGIAKVLKVLTENNSKAIELFQQEAKVLSQLNSAGIPKVESDGYFTVLPKNSSVPLHCLVMEKIEGVDLEQWMKSRQYKPISQDLAVNWLRQLVEILGLVHAHQYFHRDIKPQNIMLRSNGHLVLIDFGAVRQVTTTILSGNCNTKIISQGYSPPEQQNGYSVKQSDFFALGRTFIFLLTGKEPQDATIYDPLTNELYWQNYAPHISSPLADLIDHLMASTASQRPKNTQVILQCLKEIEKGLHTPHSTQQAKKALSVNASKSTFVSSSFATVSVSGVKSFNASSKQIQQKNQKLWSVFICLSVGLFAGTIATLNQSNSTKPVVFSPLKTVPITTSDSEPSSIVQVPQITQEAQSKPPPISLNLPTSDKLETEHAQIETIKKQKVQATFKAEQEKQAAIKKKEADRTEKMQLETVIRVNKHQDTSLLAQKRQKSEKKPQAKQAVVLTKQAPNTTVKTKNKRQLLPKQQFQTQQPKKPVNLNDNDFHVPKPWESTYPIPKKSDELEQVIREGNKL
jgi:serine/threonine protein kinase